MFGWVYTTAHNDKNMRLDLYKWPVYTVHDVNAMYLWYRLLCQICEIEITHTEMVFDN